MPYSLSILIQLGPDNMGQVLNATLVSADQNTLIGPITDGFQEIDQGDYLFTYPEFPDDFQGMTVFQGHDVDGNDLYMAAVAINPQEFANSDIKTSDVVTQINAVLVKVSGAVVEVRNPILEAERIDLIRGDDYTVNTGRQLVFTPTDPEAWPAAPVGTVVFLGVGTDDDTIFECEGSITSIDPQVATIEVKGVDTLNVGRGHYGFTLRQFAPNGTQTLAQGVLNIRNGWGGYTQH